MKRQKKETMEHDEAPSGFVTLGSYKEPFMPFEGGYGFSGVLLFDGKTEKVQCHLCGEWFAYLPKHLHREHTMRAKEYKEKVGLRQSTALISEKQRENLIATHLDIRLKNLRSPKKHSEETKEKIRMTQKNITREGQNQRGTCPAQLLDRIKTRAKELGRTPKTKEVSFYKTVQQVFGSWSEAVRLAGLHVNKEGGQKYSDAFLLCSFENFTRNNGRLPSGSDFRRGLLPSQETYIRHFGSMKKVAEII